MGSLQQILCFLPLGMSEMRGPGFEMPGLGGETSPAAVDRCHHVTKAQLAPAGGEGGLGGGVVGGLGHEAVGFLLEWKWLAQSRERYRRG